MILHKAKSLLGWPLALCASINRIIGLVCVFVEYNFEKYLVREFGLMCWGPVNHLSIVKEKLLSFTSIPMIRDT